MIRCAVVVAKEVAALSVLVVEDNAHMRKLVCSLLKALGGIETMEAGSTGQAWDVVQKRRPDVIVLDWMLGEESGIHFARKLRAQSTSPTPFVPIIMLTAYSSAEHVREARDAGVNEFLVKPVSVAAIYSRLLMVTQNPRPYIRTETYFGPCRRRTNSGDYKGPERRGCGQTTELA
jgi:two-component system, chemotaxis family, chemotaxis protein CheY